MVSIVKPKIYTCQKTTCGKQWPQRLKTVYEKDGLTIKKIIGMPKPKNCTKCKSPTWEIRRN